MGRIDGKLMRGMATIARTCVVDGRKGYDGGVGMMFDYDPVWGLNSLRLLVLLVILREIEVCCHGLWRRTLVSHDLDSRNTLSESSHGVIN